MSVKKNHTHKLYNHNYDHGNVDSVHP